MALNLKCLREPWDPCSTDARLESGPHRAASQSLPDAVEILGVELVAGFEAMGHFKLSHSARVVVVLGECDAQTIMNFRRSRNEACGFGESGYGFAEKTLLEVVVAKLVVSAR